MRTRLGLKVLGLCALVVGVMAIGTAGVAQAETGACWLWLVVENGATKCFGENGTDGKPLEPTPILTIENAATTAATLLINNKNIEITCRTAVFSEGGQLGLNGTILLGRITFGKCFTRKSTEKGLEVLGACEPTSAAGAGTVITEKGTGLIVLHEVAGKKIPLVKLSPDVGTTLAVINLGELCGAGESITVSGFLDVQDTSIEEHKLTHLIVESALHLMTVGGVAVTIDGSAEVKLPAPHNALLWGGKPA